MVDDMFDVWGGEDDDGDTAAAEKAAMSREAELREEAFSRMGYRDGVGEGVNAGLRESFPSGLREGAEAGSRWGRAKGFVRALCVLPRAAAEAAVGGKAAMDEIVELQRLMQSIKMEEAATGSYCKPSAAESEDCRGRQREDFVREESSEGKCRTQSAGGGVKRSCCGSGECGGEGEEGRGTEGAEMKRNLEDLEGCDCKSGASQEWEKNPFEEGKSKSEQTKGQHVSLEAEIDLKEQKLVVFYAHAEKILTRLKLELPLLPWTEFSRA